MVKQMSYEFDQYYNLVRDHITPVKEASGGMMKKYELSLFSGHVLLSFHLF